MNEEEIKALKQRVEDLVNQNRRVVESFNELKAENEKIKKEDRKLKAFNLYEEVIEDVD